MALGCVTTFVMGFVTEKENWNRLTHVRVLRSARARATQGVLTLHTAPPLARSCAFALGRCRGDAGALASM